MIEREDFRIHRRSAWFAGLFLLGFAAVLGALLLLPAPPRAAAFAKPLILVGALGIAFVGLWNLSLLRRTGAQVMVDRNGLTDLRLGPDAIPWAEVERCDLLRGRRGASFVRLVLRPGSQTAARLGKSKVIVNDWVLDGGTKGVRGAIARLAPQLPRDW